MCSTFLLRYMQIITSFSTVSAVITLCALLLFFIKLSVSWQTTSCIGAKCLLWMRVREMLVDHI